MPVVLSSYTERYPEEIQVSLSFEKQSVSHLFTRDTISTQTRAIVLDESIAWQAPSDVGSLGKPEADSFGESSNRVALQQEV